MLSHDSIFRTCVRGIFSCRWNSSSERTACCGFLFLSFVSILALSWMYVCFIAFNDQSDLNGLAFTIMKRWVNWYIILMIISAVVATYCLLLLVFGLIHFAIREPLVLHCLHKVFLCLGLLIVALGTVGFSVKWTKEWQTIYMSFQATAPFLQLGAVGALTLISWLVFQSFHGSQSVAFKVFIMVIFLVVSVAVFLCPLVICSPCITSNLYPRPSLVGHRGAPMLAPENTLMSFNRSLQCEVEAFETDVQLSKDKTTFLMHDHGENFLLRTTDVKDRFKGRENGTHSDFTWAEIQQLNAGKWFVETDPFWTVSRLKEEEKNQSKEQTVPSLTELLDMAKKHKVSIIFDLKNEKSAIEFKDSDSYYTVETIKNSNISPEKIWWLPWEHRHNVSKIEPGFKQVYNNVRDMDADGGSFLNVQYSSLSAREIRDLRERNVSVNVWVVNERWLFSLLWCSGVTSVTTNACHLFKDMQQPDWHLSPNWYKGIWISADAISVLLMFGVFLWQKRRMRIIRQNQKERGVPLLGF